ncbi:methyltransferase domain-containing protein [Bacillus sp. FSL K6-3431]|uniref:methyltransferase domain-containing protein n=1 Tax=Bacillus sp. FSL K6-3431 TaxID=2921500 RepID=UPI0030FC239A
MDIKNYDRLYSNMDYHWGKEPNKLVNNIFDFLPSDSLNNKVALDLGCGEGRDSVFLAKKGCKVIGVEILKTGLLKAEKLANENGVNINLVEGNINSFIILEKVDVLIALGILQYLKPENRLKQIKHFKEMTKSGGLHVLFAFTEHPEIEDAPDWGEEEFLYKQGELLSYYDDWEPLLKREYIMKDITLDRTPHTHFKTVLIVRKP